MAGVGEKSRSGVAGTVKLCNGERWERGGSADRCYMYDELAACTWLHPSLVTKSQDVFMDVDLSHGPSYGRTLAWSEKMTPKIELPLVHAQLDVDVPRFTKMVVQLLSAK